MPDLQVVADPGTHEIVNGMLQSGVEGGATESFDRLDEYLAKG